MGCAPSGTVILYVWNMFYNFFSFPVSLRKTEKMSLKIETSSKNIRVIEEQKMTQLSGIKINWWLKDKREKLMRDFTKRNSEFCWKYSDGHFLGPISAGIPSFPVIFGQVWPSLVNYWLDRYFQFTYVRKSATRHFRKLSQLTWKVLDRRSKKIPKFDLPTSTLWIVQTSKGYIS